MTRPFILLTGATDGIGRQTAFDLLDAECDLILHGRNADKLGMLQGELRAHAPNARIETVRADLSSLAEVRGLAEEVKARFPDVDVLLHNAGVFMTSRLLTVDGYEATFAVNHLAPFLLTHLLLPTLQARPEARVVLVSSIAHTRGVLDFENLQGERAWDGVAAYSLSKLANVLFAVELARRLGAGSSVTVNALHPGVVSTKLLKTGFGIEGRDSLKKGAETSVFLATSPAVSGVTGAYFVRCERAPMSRVASDIPQVERFYRESCALTGIAGLP